MKAVDTSVALPEMADAILMASLEAPGAAI